MSRLLTTQCHFVADGSLATVRRTCSTKSASVRVGPLDGLKTCPVATSKLMKNEQVPWRVYSNSRRATCPGRGGRSGAKRSSACTCVSSSVLTVRWPAWARSGAVRYTAHTSAILASRSASPAGVSQYRTRCGCRSAAFQQPRGMARRDAVGDPPPHDLVGQLAEAPFADRTLRAAGVLARQRHDLAHLLRTQARPVAGSGRLGQTLGHAQLFQRQGLARRPAPPPKPNGLFVHWHLPRDLNISPPAGRQQ